MNKIEKITLELPRDITTVGAGMGNTIEIVVNIQRNAEVEEKFREVAQTLENMMASDLQDIKLANELMTSVMEEFRAHRAANEIKHFIGDVKRFLGRAV